MTERSWCDNAKLTTVIEKLPYPVDFADSSGTRVMVALPPQRVLSLLPAVTEIIFQLGAGGSVKGVTSYDTQPVEATQKNHRRRLLGPLNSRH